MKALIVVDVQNDFMPGGALPVTEGDRIVPIINEILTRFDTVVFTQDWHPVNHCSFKENGGSWPVHCVENTDGAALHKDVVVQDWDVRVTKGMDPIVDSYSGFFDNDKVHATGLHDHLQELNVDEIFICGLATDYCVKFTAIDAAQIMKGSRPAYKVHVLLNACRGVNVNPGDVNKAIEEMRQVGIHIRERL